MNFDFNTAPQRRHTDSIKWHFFDEDVLPMWVADMDFFSPPSVIQALQERIGHGIFGYPYLMEATKEAVQAWLAKRFKWQVAPEALIFLPGVVTGFNLATHAVTKAGDGVLVQRPTYRPFLEVHENVGREEHAMTLLQDKGGSYQVEEDAFIEAIRSNTGIFMLCNPQNPTGRVFRKEELEMMAEICLKNDIIICSDEIHGDLIFSESYHIPIATLDPEIADQTITLLAPSKTFNVAGLKASIAVITNPHLRKKFQGARGGLVGWVNTLGQIAAQAAYSKGEAWLDSLLVYLQANRDYLVNFVEKNLPGIQLSQPEGTYLAWLDCRRMKVENPQQFFLEVAKVGLNPGRWFGEEGKGFVRLNFGCPRSTLVKGLERMQKALAQLEN